MTTHSYPATINQIPYASFLEIKRWSYDKAQSEVMKNQKDASGLLANSSFQPAEAVENFLANNVGKDIVSSKTSSTEDQIRDVLRKEMVDEANATAQDAINAQKEDSDWSFARDEEVRNARLEAESFRKNLSDDQINERLNGTEWAKDALDAEQEREEEFRRQQAGLVNIIDGKPDSCNLALPNEFQYGYGADWSNTFKLGTLALLAENPGAAMAVAGTAGISNMLGSFATMATTGSTTGDLGKAFGGGVKWATDPFSVGTKLNLTNFAAAAGLAPNENAMQFFKKMDFRSFDFNFQLAARNGDESTQIESLIQWFKVAMHPGALKSSGSSVLLDFPDVFELCPKFVAAKDEKQEEFGPVRHPMLPKTKLCALTNLKVNATPMAQLTTVFDGSFPLITMSLTFTELTALTKADFGLDKIDVPKINQRGLTKDGYNQRKENGFYNY